MKQLSFLFPPASRAPLLACALLALGLLSGGCGQDKAKPAQLYDPGQEAQQKAIAEQSQAAYKKRMHDQHMPGY